MRVTDEHHMVMQWWEVHNSMGCLQCFDTLDAATTFRETRESEDGAGSERQPFGKAAGLRRPAHRLSDRPELMGTVAPLMNGHPAS